MNKTIFMSILKKKLKRLPKEELYNVTNYYEEYFQDSNKNEDEVIAELGSPSIIASQILSDYAISDKGNSLSISNKILIAILAILAAPIGIPLIIAGISILFAITICIFSVLFAVSAAVFSIMASGVIFIIAGFAIIFTFPATACLYIGIGLIIAGMSILFVFGMKYIFPKISLCLKNLLSQIISKFNSYRKRG